MNRLMLDDLYSAMPWDALDAVVFDVGNVLVRFVPEDILRRVLPGEEKLWPDMLRKVFRSPYWVMLDRGVLTDEEAAAAMTGQEKHLAEPIRRLLADWRDLPDVVEEGVATLRQCKAHGKRTYVLSNYNAPAFDFLRGKYDFFRLFDGEVVSGREKLVKPDAAIYRLLNQRYALTPQRTLFIDDTPANVEAAICQGWQGICYTPGKLERFFALNGAEKEK